MYLDRNWKLMLNKDDEPYRLFDVRKDPHELEDLIGRKEHDTLIAELNSNLLDRRERLRALAVIVVRSPFHSLSARQGF